MNSARPIENMRRRPNRSPSRPAVITKIAEVSAYPAITHSIALSLAPRSDCIDGSATLTMKKSSTTMNVPARTTGSGSQRLASAGRALTSE